MKILLLVTTFNSLSQLLYTYLRDRGDMVDVVYATSQTRDAEIEAFEPEMIVCPFLQHYVPSHIYERYPTFIVHPGPKGDRGAYALETALTQKQGGVSILKANEAWDGGDLYAYSSFDIERNTNKSSLYRQEIKAAFYDLLKPFFANFEANKFEPQVMNPLHQQSDITIDWECDDTQTVVNKIRLLDSTPGVQEEILGMRCRLFGAHREAKIGTENHRDTAPKTVLAKRDGAICLKTIDGAVWITHLQEEGGFKLPATYVLKSRLKGIREDRLPLIFDRSYETFFEVSADIDSDVGYLYFNFHNGAFRAEQCMRLKYAIEYLKTQVKVLVLMGGEDFFSNGINLNILEDSKKSGEDGWATINAINDLVASVIYAEEAVTVASLHRNAGAGGVFLAAACDYVVASDTTVLNPHYKTIGLSGSEYHTYTFPKRVGEKEARRLLEACLPISAAYANKIGLVDAVFSHREYDKVLKAYVDELIEDASVLDDFLWEKQAYLEAHKEEIEQCKTDEISVMHPEFWDEESPFHALRQAFVYKQCPLQTPERLKYKRENIHA